MRIFAVPQLDELNEINRLMLAAEMAVFGSVSLDPLERAALNTIASLVSTRMRALVDAINEHDDAECAAADASPVPAAAGAEPKSPAARPKRKGK